MNIIILIEASGAETAFLGPLPWRRCVGFIAFGAIVSRDCYDIDNNIYVLIKITFAPYLQNLLSALVLLILLYYFVICARNQNNYGNWECNARNIVESKVELPEPKLFLHWVTDLFMQIRTTASGRPSLLLFHHINNILICYSYSSK